MDYSVLLSTKGDGSLTAVINELPGNTFEGKDEDAVLDSVFEVILRNELDEGESTPSFIHVSYSGSPDDESRVYIINNTVVTPKRKNLPLLTDLVKSSAYLPQRLDVLKKVYPEQYKQLMEQRRKKYEPEPD